MTIQIAKQRVKAFQKQEGLCYYCKSKMWRKNIKDFATKHSISTSQAARFQCTAEHLTARSDGGSNKENNIVAACIFCNQNRHKRKQPPPPIKYKALIYRRIKQGKWHPKELHHLVQRVS